MKDTASVEVREREYNGPIVCNVNRVYKYSSSGKRYIYYKGKYHLVLGGIRNNERIIID